MPPPVFVPQPTTAHETTLPAQQPRARDIDYLVAVGILLAAQVVLLHCQHGMERMKAIVALLNLAAILLALRNVDRWMLAEALRDLPVTPAPGKKCLPGPQQITSRPGRPRVGSAPRQLETMSVSKTSFPFPNGG